MLVILVSVERWREGMEYPRWVPLKHTEGGMMDLDYL